MQEMQKAGEMIMPDEIPASIAYPRLRPVSAVAAKAPPDLLSTQLRLEPIGQAHGCFPYLPRHNWDPEMGYDFLVPCHHSPRLDHIALTGMAGERQCQACV